MALKPYPIGIQTFSEIMKNDRLYIDKTEYVYRMTHTSGKYIFLNLPRRFGKSLLVTTLQSYFEGKNDLFKGLAIEKLEKEWTEYPVLHFDMSGGKHMEKEQLDRYLDFILAEQEERFDHVRDGYHFSDVSPDVFNPFSLLNCFAERKFGSYWFSTGTPTYLINMLRKFEVLPTEIASKEALASAFDTPTENMKTITPLLYQSGYVTIKNYRVVLKITTVNFIHEDGLTSCHL